MWQREAVTFNWDVQIFPEGMLNQSRNIDAMLIDGDARKIWRETFAMVCHEIEEDVLVETMPGEFEDGLLSLLVNGSFSATTAELIPVSGQQ